MMSWQRKLCKSLRKTFNFHKEWKETWFHVFVHKTRHMYTAAVLNTCAPSARLDLSIGSVVVKHFSLKYQVLPSTKVHCQLLSTAEYYDYNMGTKAMPRGTEAMMTRGIKYCQVIKWQLSATAILKVSRKQINRLVPFLQRWMSYLESTMGLVLLIFRV